MSDEVINVPVIKLLLSCIHSWNASFLTGGNGRLRARERGVQRSETNPMKQSKHNLNLNVQ